MCAPKPLLKVISEILDAGVNAIQLREKDLDDVALYKLAHPISKLCRTNNTRLFINTNVQVAIDVGAAGVHLPDVDDVSIIEIKAQADSDFLVGCSVHSVDTAKKRETECADFITYSPIYRTISKQGYGPAVGLESLKKLTEQVKLPVFALGGVTPARVGECLQAGGLGIAVMSGIMSSTDAGKRAKAYRSALIQRTEKWVRIRN